jgi:hypothetical protein
VLTRQQRNKLIALMHAEWDKLKSSDGYVDLSHAGPCEVTPESVEIFYVQETSTVARINAGAREFLSEYQHGALTAFHAAAIHEMETRMGLMLAMSATMDAHKEEK